MSFGYFAAFGNVLAVRLDVTIPTLSYGMLYDKSLFSCRYSIPGVSPFNTIDNFSATLIVFVIAMNRRDKRIKHI